MKTGAGIAGILLGIFSLTYIGIIGGMVGSAATLLGSIPFRGNTLGPWAETVSLLSWVAPLVTIIGGIVTFSYPRAGGVLLGASALLHWYLLGLGTIGTLFVFPIGAAALLALFAKSSSTNRRIYVEPPSSGDLSGPRFDRAKWNALLQYDTDIAAVADKLRPLGQKWLDELGSSYLALNDKQYLGSIEQKILAGAKSEVDKNEQARIRLEELRQEYSREQERLARERQRKLQLWQASFWGTRQRRMITSIATIFSVAAAAVAYVYVTAPPSRPTDLIVWPEAKDSFNCFNFDCLRALMQQSGANIKAIQFAERLSASSVKGPAAWAATGLHHFGHMDIVTYSGPNETAGLVFVDRDLRIIDPNVTNFAAMLRSFAGFTAQHPYAFVIARPQVVGTAELPDGRIRFSLQYPVAVCMACTPLAALQVPWDFNKAGRAAGMEPGTLRPWSERLPELHLE